MKIPRQRLLLPIVSLAMAASAAAQTLPADGELSPPVQFFALPPVSLMPQKISAGNPATLNGAQVLLGFKDSDIKFSLPAMMEILRDHRHEGWVLAAYPDPNTGRPLIGAGFSLDVQQALHPQRDPLNPHPFVEPSSADLWQAAGLAPDRLQQILDQYDHNVAAWSSKTYRRKIVHHTLTPQVTEEEATQLLRISALQAIYNARAYCRGFEHLTAAQQMALSQLVFQMGTNLEQFVQFLNTLNDENNARELAQLDGYMETYGQHWTTVQGTLIDSQWARRYSARAATVIAMFDPEYSQGPSAAELRVEATLRPPASPRPRTSSTATLRVASYNKRSAHTHSKKPHDPQNKRKLT
jgi:GH24 family phage-related lysozyme (muramidase)